MSVKKHLRAWLYFPKSDRLGAIILLLIICTSLVLPAFFKPRLAPLPPQVSAHLDVLVDSFVRIKRTYQNDFHAQAKYPRKQYPVKQLVNINAADSAALEALPFIGEKLAARIVRFREAAGGFYSVEQILDVYGVRDSAYQIFRPRISCDGRVRKLGLDTASRESLQRHPYIRYKLAALMVNYRTAHNGLRIADLEKIPGFDSLTLRKLGPYLK